MIYSLDEKVVGKWIDGKDLYQRSYYIDDLTLTDGYLTFVSDASFIDKLVYAEGVLNGESVQTPFIMDGGHNNNNYITIGRTFDSESDTIDIGAGPSALTDFTDAYVTIRYTKKTI